MKKKLTVNDLAIGNLKARKKQYITMIIGILLAMILSSSIVFFLFSASETRRVSDEKELGYQDAVIAAESFDAEDYKKLVDKKYITSYAFAHNIGYAYTQNENVTAGICWLEDDAKEKSNQIFLEGRYPTADNEIAIEHSELLNFGIPKAKLGDKIKLNIKVQNGNDTLEKSITKEYTLVGIVSDKAYNIDRSYEYDNNSKAVPSVFVKQGTPVYEGGKELLISYVSYNYDELKNTAKELMEKKPDEFFDEDSIIREYLEDETSGKYFFNSARVHKSYGLSHFDNLFPGGDIMSLVVFVMIFAACISIINAFNSNLKDRKQQIGMMRAVGTTKRQIINIYGREAFIISLIVTPLSVLISYLLVKLALNLISDEAVMSKSIWALPIAAVVNIIVVMLAAYIPLKSASRITPMQAIRNIKNNRKTKTRKIKTKKQFNTSKLWAKRSLTFYKGSHIAVSIILCATILFSCVSASAISYATDNLKDLPYDYVLTDYDSEIGGCYNSTGKQIGFTQSDYQQIYSKPYVSEVRGSKTASVNMVVDEYNDYLYAQEVDTIAYLQLSRNGGSFDWPKNAEDYKKVYEDGIKNNVMFSSNRNGYDDYYKNKKELKIPDNKEFYSFVLNANEDKAIRSLEDMVIDGRIDYSKLASGKEVIMIAPQKFEVRMKFYKSGGYGTMTAMDDEISKKELGYKTVVSAECPYKAGDTIELLVADADVQNHSDDESEYTTYDIKSVKKHKVKIGAIVRPKDSSENNISLTGANFGLLTNMQGMSKIHPGGNYYNLYINSSGELDEERNLEIMEDLEYFKAGSETRWLESNYEYITNQKESTTTLLVAMICVTIIGFAICTSIINNSITSKIRENKKVIGMLRTVGADTGTLVKSFIIQMLSMFGWGIGTGYGLYLLVLLGIEIAKKLFMNWYIELSFSPWFSIGMTVLMFIICSINLYTKIRKEMKNSIIENIREL